MVKVTVIFETQRMKWLHDGSFLYKEGNVLFWRSLNFTSHKMPSANVHYAKGMFYYTFTGGIMEYIPTTEVYRVVACGKLELQSITLLGDIVLLVCSDRILTTTGVKVPIFGHTIHEYNHQYLITHNLNLNSNAGLVFSVFTLPDFALIHTRELQTTNIDTEKLKKRFKIINDGIIQLGGQFIRIELAEPDPPSDTIMTKRTGGGVCSVNGHRYEQVVYNTLSTTKGIHVHPVLGGSSANNDIEFTYNGITVGVEIKIFNTPDWMQISVKYDRGKWMGSINCKIPDGSRKIFNGLLDKIQIFGGEKPPFISNDITHEEWLAIKSQTSKWDDEYIDIPNDTIRKLYKAKGCYYIQLSGGYGLYHLGEDICKFGVPIFEPPQRFRVRTKVHSKCNARGYCNLSVTVACQPKNIRPYPRSPHTLDGSGTPPVIFIS